MRAGGINLAPVINRACELSNKLRLSRLAAVDLKDEQERASLFIDDSTNENISNAAMKRFGENYLGCIH